MRASDDYGLRKLGLFARPTGPAVGDEGWKQITVWPVKGEPEFRCDHSLSVSALQASEGERVELALRGVDTDPLKEGRWAAGPVHTIVVGGEGAALQTQYEQILKTEAGAEGLLADQKKAAARARPGCASWTATAGCACRTSRRTSTHLHARAKQQAARQKIRHGGGRSWRAGDGRRRPATCVWAWVCWPTPR